MTMHMIKLRRYTTRQPEMVEVITKCADGIARAAMVRKNKPRRCSAVRRICIKCAETVIHKNSRFYDSRICELCSYPNQQEERRP